MSRVACYVDGFNLYHAIAELNEPHLNWLDIKALAQSLCRDGESIVKVAYFSAYATWLPGPYARHRQYVAALKSTGVECHIARFNEKTTYCRSCGSSWKQLETAGNSWKQLETAGNSMRKKKPMFISR